MGHGRVPVHLAWYSREAPPGMHPTLGLVPSLRVLRGASHANSKTYLIETQLYFSIISSGRLSARREAVTPKARRAWGCPALEPRCNGSRHSHRPRRNRSRNCYHRRLNSHHHIQRSICFRHHHCRHRHQHLHPTSADQSPQLSHDLGPTFPPRASHLAYRPCPHLSFLATLLGCWVSGCARDSRRCVYISHATHAPHAGQR